MIPNLYPLLRDSVPLQALIGSPIRYYRHGAAPQKVQGAYVTEQTIDSVPEIILDDTPRADQCRVQISIWSGSAGTGSTEVEEIAALVRDLIEPVHNIVAIRDMGRDPDTQRYRIDLDVSVWLRRDQISSS